MEKEYKSRKKKKLGSYPYTSVVFSITLALFVIGLFGLLLLHTNRLTELIKENIEIQVYLDKEITANQRIQIQKTLSSKDFVAEQDDEVQIKYISKEDAAKDFIEDTGEDFSEFLGQNPLRDTYVIRVASEYQTLEQMSLVKNDIESISGVFEAKYEANFVDSINKNMTKISLFLLGFAVILLLVVAILINNTIKLALFSQRFLIRSMQLVGAKSSFIQKPFLLRACFHGIISGTMASAMLYFLMNFSVKKIPEVAQLQEPEKTAILFAALLLLGAIIGFMSTLRAINKYLKLSLDELY